MGYEKEREEGKEKKKKLVEREWRGLAFLILSLPSTWKNLIVGSLFICRHETVKLYLLPGPALYFQKYLKKNLKFKIFIIILMH
jgi:hypothetical protein